MQACSFFSDSFLEFCCSTPAFSSTILLHKFVQVFDTLKIRVHCFEIRDTLKQVICLILLFALFPMLCHFHLNLNIQNSLPPRSSTYSWQFSTGKLEAIASKGRTKPFPRWPQFCKQLSFHSVPSSAGFIHLILLQSLLLDFPCATQATPIVLDRLFLNVCSVGSMAVLHIALLCPPWPVEFYSSYFHQVSRFIPARVHTDGAWESPRCALYSKISIQSMS